MLERFAIILGVIAIWCVWNAIMLSTIGDRGRRDWTDYCFSCFLAMPITLLTVMLPPFLYMVGCHFIHWVIYG